MSTSTNLHQLNYNDFLEHIEDATPIEMIVQNNPQQNVKLDKLTSWHRHHGLTTYKQKRDKLIHLLGTCNFSGQQLEHINFYKTQNIWGFSYETSSFFIYYNEDGLSIEIMDECIPYLDNILDALINCLIKKE